MVPRLSMYHPNKGDDFKYIDRTIWEMFQIGGVDCLIHRYIGPGNAMDATPSTPVYANTDATNIQDLLFMENRDRKYDPDVFVIRGVYNIQDIDFNLSQFGLFLQNDTIFINFHITDTIDKLGRKIMGGDVIELPHLKDDHAANDLQFALKRYYVVEEVSRASQGFSVTWFPHLYRAKCKPLVDSQEFKDILSGLVDENSNLTLRDIMSTYEKEMQITHSVLDQANLDLPKSGYDTTSYYYNMIGNRTTGYDIVRVEDTSGLPRVAHNSYVGYLLGDGLPPNGAPFTSGIVFPIAPVENQYCVRTDHRPQRLYQFINSRWKKVEDMVRMTTTNLGFEDTAIGGEFAGEEVNQTQRSSFINNNRTNMIDGHLVKEKQSLSKALRPEADL